MNHTSPYREEELMLTESARRTQAERRRPCNDGSPYFPNYDDDLMQVLIHMARVQMKYREQEDKTEDDKRVYHDQMSQYLARLTADHDKLKAIYRSMYMDSLTSPNLRDVFHITETEGRVAESVSPVRNLQFTQGSIFLITQAGEVLMGADGSDHHRTLRYVSDQIFLDDQAMMDDYDRESQDTNIKVKLVKSTLQSETYEFEEADDVLLDKLCVRTQCPLIDCGKERKYFALVVPKPFVTTRQLYVTPSRMELNEAEMPLPPVRVTGQEYMIADPQYSYEDLIYALINPYCSKMEFTLVFSDPNAPDGTSRRTFLLPGERLTHIADMTKEPLDSVLLTDAAAASSSSSSAPYKNMMDLERYLSRTCREVYEALLEGQEGKPIQKLVFTCEPTPELFFHRWITLRQLCTLYGALKHPHEHIARHMYMWFLYDQMQKEDREEIRRLTYSVCSNQKALVGAPLPDIAAAVVDVLPDPNPAPIPGTAEEEEEVVAVLPVPPVPEAPNSADEQQQQGDVGFSLSFNPHVRRRNRGPYAWILNLYNFLSKNDKERTHYSGAPLGAPLGEPLGAPPAALLDAQVLHFILSWDKRPPMEGYSVADLERILNENYFTEAPVQLDAATTSPQSTGYILVRRPDDPDHLWCLFDVRARLDQNLAPGAESPNAFALQCATYSGILQKVADTYFHAAMPMEAVLVPDTYRPLILTRKARTTLESLPLNEEMASRVLQKFLQCLDSGLFMFTFSRNQVLVDGPSDEIYFNSWLYACRRVNPYTYQLLDTDILRNAMEEFFNGERDIFQSRAVVEQLLSDQWNKGKDIDGTMQVLSALAMMHALFEGGLKMDGDVTGDQTEKLIRGSGHSILVQLYELLIGSVHNPQDWDLVPHVLHRFWSSVILGSYLQSTKLQLVVA